MTTRAREVVDEVDRFVDLDVLGQVVRSEDERVAAQVLNVGELARLEIVDADHALPAPEKRLTEVGAQEPGTTGDDGGRNGSGILY